jgi:hypothetical protein
MTEAPILSKLEHRLLSMQVDDDEPLFVLYGDTVRDAPGVDLEQVLRALIELLDMGLSKCYLFDGKRRPAVGVTIDDLMKRFEGMSEAERKQYPSVPEYYFEITLEGKSEEAKDVYSAYYP